PDGFACPRCGHTRAYRMREHRRWQCVACRYQVSLTAGTILHNTKTALTVGFWATYLTVTDKRGMSALLLQRQLGLRRYETAWLLLHKLRRAMVRPGRERLRGRVEVDETYLGEGEAGVRGRQTRRKARIVVAAEEDGRGIGRIRMRHIPDASAARLHPFVSDAVEPGSVVHTDGWEGYTGLDQIGYRHEVTPLRGRKGAAAELQPRVHRVVSLLKRWLLGTHHGAVSQVHLDYYLDEFTFRFNRRTARHRGKLFYRLVQQAVAVEPAPYKTLTKKARGRKPQRHKM
ncbi:MAG: IS1595 family transposase, partial [Burkholderiales bacterium]